jgi:hypothetical protein
MFALSYGEGRDEKISKALKTRSAVCEGYAEVFNEICNKAGIQSKVITGYTKQKGMVDYIPHAWVASKVDNTWHLFDPTWSSGSVSYNKFIKGFTYRFYKVKPEELIKTHMPFDPMEQFLKQPLTTKAFYDGNFALNASGPVFNFEDTLAHHTSLSETDRLRNTARRIEANGVRSSMILQMLQYLRNKDLSIQADLLNAASIKANEAVIVYNRYIEYKNKQFVPRKDDKEIEKMIADAQRNIDSATVIIAGITTNEPTYKHSISQMNTNIADLQKMVAAEKLFVDKYIKTKKILRPLLFKTFG